MPIATGHMQIILSMLIWGSVGIFVRFAEQPSTTIVFFRVLIAFIAGIAYLAWKRTDFTLNGHLKLAVLSGIVISVNWLFYFKAVQTTTISNVVLIYNTAPIISILWARLFLGERLETRALYALLACLGGVALIMSGYQIAIDGQDFLGIVFALTSALFYSMVSVLGKRLSDLTSAVLLTVQTGVASLVFLPFLFVSPPEISVKSFAAMTTIGLVHTSLALALYYTGLKTVKVQHVSTYTYLDMGSAIIYAYLFFSEVPTWESTLGGAIIFISSLLLITGKSNSLDLKAASTKIAIKSRNN